MQFLSLPPHWKRPQAHDEYHHQVAIFKYAAHQEITSDSRWGLLSSSQNGLPTTIQSARKAVAAGLKKGYPDLFLPVASCGYHGLFIELKRPELTRSALSKHQKYWLNALSRQGYCAEVCFGFEETIELIHTYLNNEQPHINEGGDPTTELQEQQP